MEHYPRICRQQLNAAILNEKRKAKNENNPQA